MLHGAGARAAIDAHFGDPCRGDLDPRGHIAVLEQLAEHRLALGFDSRPQRLLKRLGSQRVGDLNVDMLFGTAVLNLPAEDFPGRAKDRDWRWTADDPEI